MPVPHPRPATAFDHAYAFALAVAFPLFAFLVVYPRLLDGIARGAPDARTSTYILTIVVQWTLAVTAGFCEELLYRGFLVGYAARVMHPVAAVLVTAAVFGFGHLYQGMDGVFQTGIAGLIAGVLYLVTRSIWPGIFIHAIVDIGGGFAGLKIATG